MSQLGKTIKTYLTSQAGYADAFPGGIHADMAPVTKTPPYAVFQKVSNNRGRLLSQENTHKSERVQFSITGNTRAEAELSAKWMADIIEGVTGPLTVDGVTIFFWQVEDETSSADPYEDGSDEIFRTIDIDIIGAYKES